MTSARTGRQVRSVLALGSFRWLFIARLFSQTADGFLQAALATFVLFSPERQASASGVALVFATLLLPYSLIGPFVGVFLDRWQRRNVLVVGNLIRGAVIAVIAWQVLRGHSGPDLFLTVLAALACNRVVLTAQAVSLANTVPAESLVLANSFAPTAGTVISAVATVVGALIRTAVGGDTGSLVVVVLSCLAVILSALSAARIDRGVLGPHDVQFDTVRDVLVGLREGAQHLRTRVIVVRAMAMVVMHRIMFGLLLVTALVLARNTFNSPTDADAALRDISLIGGAASIGAFVGAVLTPAAVRRMGLVIWPAAILSAGAVIGIGTWLMERIAVMVFGAVVVGIAATAVKVCADSLAQRDVHDDHRGRVFSLYDVALNVGLMTGITLGALLLPASGQLPALLIAMALVVLGVCGLHVRTFAATTERPTIS